MNFITKERAMTILGVSKATIYRYLQKGTLRAAHDGKRIGVYDEDVYRLKAAADNPLPIAMNAMTLAMLVARIQAAENMIATFAKILNVSYERLNLTDPEYKLLHQMSAEYATNGWPPQAEELWVGTFLRLKYEDLERMAEVIGDPHPWRPILRLAASMHLRPYSPELREQLAAGRNNVYATAGIYCTLKGDSPKTFSMLVDRDSVPEKKLMKTLEKTRK